MSHEWSTEFTLSLVLVFSLNCLNYNRNLTAPYVRRYSRKSNQDTDKKIGIAPTEATLDANFTKDLGIDSLDYSEIVMEFEQAFDIKIPDNEAETIHTLGQAVNYVSKKITK